MHYLVNSMEKKGTMKAIVRKIKSEKEGPYLTNVPIPTLLPNHVLIKVLACPLITYDMEAAYGVYGEAPYEPYVCGIEGAGIITEVGEGVPKEAIGKKVCTCPLMTPDKDIIGMWSQYARVPYSSCVFIEDSQNIEEFSCLLGNPLTILALMYHVREHKPKTIICTAAMSTLVKSLIKLCNKEGIDVIGIIRKEADLKTLLSLGAKYALNMESPDFEKQLKEVVSKTDTRVAFDAIAGDMPAKLLQNMPEKSEVFVYGILSGKKPDASSIKEQMEKESKKMHWLLVTEHKIVKDPEEAKKAFEYISKDIKSGGKLFKIDIVKRFKLDEYKEAFECYRKVSSTGKVVILPNP